MHTTNVHRVATAIACTALTVSAAACSDDDDADAARDTATAPTSTAGSTGNVEIATSSSTSTPATTAPPTVPPTAPPTTLDESWKQRAAAFCAAYLAEPPAPDWATAGIVAHVTGARIARDRLPVVDPLPDQLRAAPNDVVAVRREADALLSVAEAAATADDLAGALTALTHSESLIQHIGGLLTVAGARCGDPARATNAALNIPIPSVHQVATGFGSVWASPAFRTDIVRLDPASGEVVATIDVGSEAGKAQPADGRMIVRTRDAYVAIDPATNNVLDTLAKSDVGTFADRGWAVDGALWICEGQRVHRYDTTTLEPTGVVIELGIDCGFVYATTDLVVAWNYNEADGQSGSSAAVFIDPTTNQPLATVDLPADVTVPIVLDDAVFLPASLGSRNVVVDRTNWTVTATPDYGRQIVGSQMAFAGGSIYLPAGRTDVLVVDAHTYEVTDVIEALTFNDYINGVAVGPGALWVVTGDAGILQRFDIAS